MHDKLYPTEAAHLDRLMLQGLPQSSERCCSLHNSGNHSAGYCFTTPYGV